MHGLVGCGGGDEDTFASVPAGASASANSGSVSAVWPQELGSKTYEAAWTHTLVPEVGPLATWTVGTETGVPTVRDCWGILRHARLGEARFWGARRVENKLRASADLSNGTYWYSVGTAAIQLLSTDSRAVDPTGAYRTHRLSKTGTNSARIQILGVLPAVPHTFSIYVKAGTLASVFLQLYVSGGSIAASGTFAVNSSAWTRVQITGTPDGVNFYKILISPGPFVSAVGGSILVCDAQLEEVSGHPSAAASEYIETDRLRPPVWFYGAMVDGVRYFNTFKGNTVAAGIVTDTVGPAIPDSALHGLRIEPRTINLCRQTETFAGWAFTQGSLTVSPNSADSPRVDRTATRLTEGSNNAFKSLTCDIGLLGASSAVTVSCFAKAESGRWLRLGVTLSPGAEVIAFFDLATGMVGRIYPVSNRPCWIHIEPWANGWYRCVLTAQNYTTGALTSKMNVGIAASEGNATYPGQGNSILLWGAHAAPVEYAASYLPNADAVNAAVRQSQSVEILNANAGIVGLNDFTIGLDAVPAYYTGITIKGGATMAWRPFFSGFATGYYRDQHRVAFGLRPYSDTVFGDRYLGDPNPIHFWRPNQVYTAGMFVIPTDTQLDNANSRKMFTCVVPGVSGVTEPAWDPTFVAQPDTVTHLTNDGTVVWQVNHPDYDGKWQPFDTSHIDRAFSMFAAVQVTDRAVRTDIAATPFIRGSFFAAPGDYGFSINGERAPRDTDPFPIDGSSAGDLHRPLESIRFGRMTELATSHPLGIRRLSIGFERIDAETNRLRTLLDTAKA